MKRVIERKLVMGIADGSVSVDGEIIYTAADLRVGLFQQHGYPLMARACGGNRQRVSSPVWVTAQGEVQGLLAFRPLRDRAVPSPH